MNDEIVMYLIMNQDLKMSKGKSIAQASHVVGLICNDMGCEQWLPDEYPKLFTKQQREQYFDWLHGSMTKITLKAPQEHLEYLISLNDNRIYYIRDEGRTQIEPNSLTCVALIPMSKSEAQQFVSGLKLL